MPIPGLGGYYLNRQFCSSKATASASACVRRRASGRRGGARGDPGTPSRWPAGNGSSGPARGIMGLSKYGYKYLKRGYK